MRKFWGVVAALSASSAAMATPGHLERRTSSAVELAGPRNAPLASEIAAVRTVGEALAAATPELAAAEFDRALAMLPQPTRFRGLVLCLRANAFVDVENYRRALDSAEECNRLLPGEPWAQITLFKPRAMSGDFRGGTLLLIAAIKKQPELLTTTEVASMRWLLRQLGYAQLFDIRDQLLVTLADIRFGQNEPDFFGPIVLDAIRSHVAAQRNEQAVALLPLVLDPETGLKLLIDRRFEPIWPDIELWADGTLEKQRDARLASSKAQFEVDPSLLNRILYAETLFQSGRPDEAAGLLDAAIKDPATWDDNRYNIGTATIRHARYSRFAGKPDAGIAALRNMMGANPVKDHPHAANMMPNLARELIYAGLYQQALDLITAEMPDRNAVENEAAFGYYVALEACAFKQLGREQEMRDRQAKLRARFSTNVAANRISDRCTAPDGADAKIWIAQIEDEDSRADALIDIHRAQAWPSGAKRHEPAWNDGTSVIDDAGLKATFETYGRPLPISFVPALLRWQYRD